MRRLFVLVAVLALVVLPTAGASADPPGEPISGAMDRHGPAPGQQ